jgi:exopolysaccharide biosynthesis protein
MYMCISIVLMGIPPVPYIVYMQNRNNCVCVTLLSKRKERRTNTHTKSEKRKIETTHNAESSPRRVYGRLLFARVRQQSQGPHVVNIYVHV